MLEIILVFVNRKIEVALNYIFPFIFIAIIDDLDLSQKMVDGSLYLGSLVISFQSLLLRATLRCDHVHLSQNFRKIDDFNSFVCKKDVNFIHSFILFSRVLLIHKILASTWSINGGYH